MSLAIRKISDLGNIITGNTPPRKMPEYYGDVYPFIKPTDIEIDSRYTLKPEECYSELGYAKYRTSIIPKYSTCVVTIGSIGKKITLAHTECFINQAMNAIVPDANYDPMYVFYLLKNNLERVKSSDSGTSSGRENVSKSAFSSIEILVETDIGQQARIASILSAYDDLIENNLRQIKLLEDAASISYRKCKDDTLKDWITGSFSRFFSINNGFAFQADWYAKQGVPVVRTRDYSYTKFLNIEQPIFIDVSRSQNFSRYLLREFDFMLIMVGASIGRYGIVLEKDLPALQNQNQWALREKPTYEYLKVIKLQLIPTILETLLQHRTGAARDFFRASYLNDLQVTIPNEEIGEVIGERLRPYFSQINVLQKQNTRLRQARDLLLPKLMSGEIEVEGDIITSTLFEMPSGQAMVAEDPASYSPRNKERTLITTKN